MVGRRMGGTARAAGLAFALLLVASATGCATDAAPDEQPHILLVVCDALRADHLPLHGYERDTAPELTAWAEGALVYEHATAPSNWTRPSMHALFTGRHPAADRLMRPTQKTPAHESLMVERLAAAGYETIGISANPFMSTVHGADRGFVQFVDLGWRGADRRGHWKHEIAAPFVLDRVEYLLESRIDADRPVFLYVHLMDPHEPYDPPDELRTFGDAEYDGRFDGSSQHYAAIHGEDVASKVSPEDREQIISLYDAEILQLDRGLTRLRDLAARHLSDRRVVTVITADHGEAFGEEPSGVWLHGRGMGSQLLHVPLIVHGTGRAGRVPQRVGLVDLAPTLVALGGGEPLPDVDGLDLLARPGPPAGRDLIAYRALPGAVQSGTGELAVLRDGFRAERTDDGWRVFDVATDEDVSAYRADLLPQMSASAARWFNRSRDRDAFGEEFDQVTLDEHELRQLEALGYTGDG
ncbi:MAG: sulfatase [Planctomycetota bacterium]|jgi:arylsulfatase